MDSLTYHYNKNTNQLAEVTDVIPSTYYTVDIHNETSKHNYRYNGIGELASDSIAGIDSIYWTVYGKVKKIVKTNNDSIVFMYDPLGNRLEERTFPHSVIADTMKYTRDAQGDIMAIYDRKKDTVRLSEFDIYGNKRIGSLDTVLRMQKFITGHGTLDSLTISYLERQKQYELDNHLGNVLVTMSDGKTPIDTTATPNIAQYYLPIVINSQDYYPFGMVQPGRSYVLSGDSSYKYLFNGKYHDDNIYGKGNSYDYGKRFYDPRLGRFMSVDPIASKYPMLTPFQFSSNTPIQAIDLDGKEGIQYLQTTKYDDGTSVVQRVVELDVYVGITNNQNDASNYHKNDVSDIEGGLNKQYNNPKSSFTDDGGHNVVFKFNVETFDVDKISPTDEAKILTETDREPGLSPADKSRPAVGYKGLVLVRDDQLVFTTMDNGEEGQEGGQTFAHGYNMTEMHKSLDNSHNRAHEVAHFFLKNDPTQPKSEAEHDAAGGIFIDKSYDRIMQQPINEQPLNKNNVKEILKWVPEVAPKEINGGPNPNPTPSTNK